MRVATAAAIAGQVLLATPVLAQDAAKAAIKAGNRAMTDVNRAIAKSKVHVNRTVPKVTPPNIDPMFGMNVTTDVLMRARVFAEQLIPTGQPTVEQNAALARMLERVALSSAEQRGTIIDEHIQSDPTSPWRASLVANAGTLYAREGYFSRAAAYWNQAWELTRDSDDRTVRVLADYALGESIDQMVKFGQVAKLEARLKETEGRDVRGPAGTKVADGWEGLRTLTQHHETALLSGPEALKAYLTVKPIADNDAAITIIARYHPTMAGTSMTELRELGAKAGIHLSMWHASVIDQLPVPSIIHLRSQHFSAVVEYKDGKYRLRDPGLGGDVWLSEAALRDETTGFVMTAGKPTGDDWREASDGDGQRVVGHCTPGKPSLDDDWIIPGCGGGGSPGSGGGGGGSTGGGGHGGGGGGCGCPPCGMPYYTFHPAAATLVISDTPLSYSPPVGPSISLRLSYTHRSYKTPSTFGYGNVGPLWTFDSLAYIIDNGVNGAKVAYLRGYGREYYDASQTQASVTKASLVQVSHDPARYERTLLDGTVEVYDLADRAASLPERRIFLTSVTDPQGHTIEYTYDSSFRVVAVEDALGQVTTFEYEHASDPSLLTKVTDPFERFATLGYDAEGRLNSITDAAGMTSTFTYTTGDFITAMMTPYGTTSFRHEPGNTSATYRLIEAVDPVGGRERLEFVLHDATFPATMASADVPTGFSGSNEQFDYWNSFYWDKLAMATHPDDRAYAVNYTWMLEADSGFGHNMSRPIPHTMKRPLESRVWFRYPNQPGTSSHVLYGSGAQPSLIGRVLDGGASQVVQIAYNSKGKVASYTDPLGRQTTYAYATNGLDLLDVHQAVSGGTDLLQSFSSYNSIHLPATATDGALQDTDFIYNSLGQPLTVTNAKNETTTFAYDATAKTLTSVTGAVSGATTSFTYDAIGRVETVTTSDGYVMEFEYDALNRLISKTYPDATTETFTYNRLDLTEVKDRLGRITRHFYDGYGRRIATRDPAGRTISYVWCKCGVLDALVDAKGNRTTWERDINGRVTREIRADGTTDTLYTYDGSGRLSTVTDPMDQVTTYTYNTDDSLASTGFTNETIATPDIFHTYDTYYPRAATMVDGNGTTTYSYVAAGTNGAGALASVDGPFSNDTINYTYDELGRVATRMLNSTGTEITYDSLGRLSALEFPIGTFDYTYVGHTGRRASVTYPNDQTTQYSYFDDEHDFRLQTIHHKNPSAATLSKFDYTYDTVGNILTWRQERAGSAAKIYTFTHDLVDQLTSAVLTDTSTPATILKRQAWSYDVAGNRTVDQTDDAVFATTHDSMNRLQSRAPGGPIVFAGSLNETGTVTIDGKPAQVDGSNNFRGTATLSGATTTVTVKAKDASGNETTNQYEVDATGSSTSYSYDANGNLTSDGTKTYHWNALNQLVEVKQGATTLATFEYDGEGRRTEKAAAGDAHVYVYDAEDIIEERISGTSSDTLRFYHGVGIDEPLARENSSAVETYYLADHLGSIVQETNTGGSVELGREYDPWGNLLAGSNTAGYAASGREWDSETQLYHLRARYLDQRNGRFLSQDPIGLLAGPNQYSFVGSNPLRFVDPFGLCSEDQNQGNQTRPRNQLDEAYRRLVTRGGTTKTVLEEAIPDIAKGSKAMGELSTYELLAETVLLLNLMGGPGKIALNEIVFEIAVTEPVLFNATVDLILARYPVPPSNLIQLVSNIYHRAVDTLMPQ